MEAVGGINLLELLDLFSFSDLLLVTYQLLKEIFYKYNFNLIKECKRCRKAKVKLLTIQLILREGISYNRSQDSIEYLAGLSFNKNKKKDFYFHLTPVSSPS